ncbi:MAG: UDP-glucose 4-epimerase GalE [Crocinitomicaceae bacterium TMED45]|nr:MAG: UDP-glucose 4-epimerase GalE [Crocinitomicaceae bacterium TMED45]|tara:strand:- start:1034 stop:2065 length:1032 start_codon:yes stop_codon:yes gene_type:complete
MLQNQNTKVLITGATGYVGSHVTKLLNQLGYKTIVVDRNVNSRIYTIEQLSETVFYEMSYGDESKMATVFESEKPDAVIHLAANSLVGPSVTDPHKYYQNNVSGTISLLGLCVKHNVKKFIFASTSSVYGNGHTPPIKEDVEKRPLSSYGRSKWIVEQLLQDYYSAYGLNSVSLRYFNVCGADPEHKLGEVKNSPTHLIPSVMDTALGRRDVFKIFGTDYNTVDGTAVRDYTHVWDIARAHSSAIDYLNTKQGAFAFNIGASGGHSVRQVVNAMSKTLQKTIPVEEHAPREGDPECVIADVSLAEKEMGWKAEKSDIDTICQDTVQWFNTDIYKKIDIKKVVQ